VEIITQLEDERITQSQDVPRSNRQYISAEKIRLLAQTKFKQSREGITYEDLVNDGSFKCVNIGQRAQDTLHYHKREGNLFTQGRTNPQQYFATEDDAEMAAIFREKNTHSDPTGVKYSSHASANGHYSSRRDGPPLANTLGYSRIQDFYHALLMLKVAPLAMHNIRLYLKLTDPQRYDVIPPQYEEENRARVIRDRKGDVHITTKVYPHGTVEITIECSKAAFPIETDFDITKLFSFVGEIRNTLQGWLHDVNDHIIPPIEQWRFAHADISKDVKVPKRLHLTVPNMELTVADRVLRMYVKNLGHGSVLRLEEMRMFEEAFGDAANSLREGASSSSTAAIFTQSLNPAALVENAELKRQIAMLTSQMAEIQEMMVESHKQSVQEIRFKKETECGEQVVLYDEKEESNNTEKSDSSNDDGYKQTPLNNRLSIIATNSTKVENNKVEMLVVKQQQQQPIAIPPSTMHDDDVPIMISSAAELLEQRNNSNNYLRISTGSKRLDDLLSGGIERGAVTEISGPAGSGKTELCLTLSVTAQQKQKHEKISVDGRCEEATSLTRVLFIDTKKTFDRHRIYSIARARGLDPDAAVESITVETIQDFQALEEFIFKRLEEFLKKNPDTVLVIVDGILALQMRQIKGKRKEGLSLWQQSLDSPIYSLRRSASEYNIAVVITNNADEIITDYPIGEKQVSMGEDIMTPHASTYRLNFKNYEQYKVARIVYSPCHPEEEAVFTIGGEGITDIH